MTKTKFLSRVLAVLMVLSMLCSTGVFADYNSGLTAGDAAVTGTITMSGTKLNDGISFWSADTVAEAKWFDVTEGFKLHLTGTADAATGTITYAVAPVDTFAADPFDPVQMEATAIAIGTADIADNKFNFKIEADQAKIVKNVTYELRLAYSNTEIASVTDASALVYQRYFKSYDWADATVKSANVVNKLGIGDITIDIEGNPLRASLNDTYENAVKYIRTDSLDNGSILQTNAVSTSPDTRFYGQTEYVETSNRSTIVMDVGSELLGGVVLGYSGGPEHNDVSVGGNIPYRFKATQSGTAYIVGIANTVHPDWDAVTGVATISQQPYHVKNSSGGFKYVAPTEEGAEGTFTMMSSKTAASKEGLKLNESWYTPERYLKLPTANLDADGNWQYGKGMSNEKTATSATTAPYSMYRIYDFGTNEPSGRGFVYQGHEFDKTYQRTFEAGEWVEVPYPDTTAYAAESFVVVQFDVPQPKLASASVTSTLDPIYAYAGTAATSATLTTGGTQEVAFAADATEYVVNVPYGTKTAAATITTALGTTATANVDLTGVASKTATVTIGDYSYDVTFKWDDTHPYVYNVKFNYMQYANRSFVMRAAQNMYTFATNKLSANIGGATVGADSEYVVAKAGQANTQLVINDEAIPNDEYLTMIAPSYSDAFYRGQQTGHTSKFHKAARVEQPNWISFTASAPGTVYITATHANAAEEDFVWDEAAAAGWTKVESASIRGVAVTVFKKSFNTGDTVNVPTQMIKQAEIDYVNAKLQAAYPADNGDYQFKYVLGSGGIALLNYSNDGKAYDAADKAWTQIEQNLAKQTIGTHKNIVGDYMRGHATGVGTFGNRNFFLAVAFNQPLSLSEVTYAVDGGDAETVAFAAGETTANIEVPYNATTVSVAATKTGTGTVTVEPAELDLTGVASGTATVTLAAPGAEPIVYTINFVKGAPKILWESAIAPTGKLTTQSQGIYSSIYKDGLYNVGAQEGSLDLTATEIDLVVPYGVEVVKFNGDVSVNLLSAENHAASATVTINGTDYTVNVSWAAYEYKEGMPRLYDLEYGVEGKTALYAETRYYAIPKALVFDAEHDYVLGTGDLLGTDGNGNVTVERLEGAWFTTTSHNKVNLSSTNNGAQVNRLHLGPQAFQTWVDNGDLDSIYALNGATILVADYTDVVANDAVRYKFKAAHAGYVIVACNKANSNFAAANGWTRLEGNTMKFTNGSTTAQGTALTKPPVVDGVTHVNSAKSFAEWSGACNYIYMKKVAADEVIEIKESTVASEYPPVVIVATEDMVNERIVAPTVLESLSYTTALAVTAPKESVAANGHSAESLHANGLYQPTLVTEAATVAVAADATTVNVTVPYGSEIVNLAGVDNYNAAVEFDAINLINNNGAATVTKTVGEVTYTINVAWAAYDAASDAAGNHIYDIKYRIKDLANTTYYNIVPTKLVLTENRIAPMAVDGYKLSGETYKLVANAGEWYDARLVGGANSNLLTQNNGAQINRGRASLIAFDGWVRNGLVTASGFPGAALPEDATDAEVDAIAYAAMNGATTLVVHYQDYTSLDTAAGANAAMAEHLTFKVAQDSIVYVSSSSSSIGAEWTKVSAGNLYLHNQVNDPIYGKNEDDTYTKLFSNSYIHHDYTAGGYAYYRYAKAGDIVSLTLNKAESNMPPVVLVRPIDFTAAEAPALDTISYKIGDGEATAVEFAEGETTATFEVPWGNTDTISLAATISGVGNVSVSDAIALSKENREGAITVTLTDVIGEAAGTYTVNFVWAAAPAVESVTYSTARTLYKGAVVEDAELTAETQEIEVPWGTASVTVSYKLEGADAVALKAVDFVDNEATVEVELPEETITLTFVYGDAPAGQYITGLTKYPNSWRDRMFASYGDVDDAYVSAAAGYKPSGAQFFSDNRVPEGLAKPGEIVVIADAAANGGLAHMALKNFPYMGNSYPATAGDGSDAWMSFTVAKAGKLYAVAPQFDEVWVELENLGWTEAPFDLKWGDGYREVYQRDVAAGELIYMPGAQILDREIEAYNEYLAETEAGYSYKRATEEDIAAINAAIAEMIAAGTLPETAFKGTGTEVGDILRVYDAGVEADAGQVTINGATYTRNIAGFYITGVDAKHRDGIELQFGHYTRENAPVLFAVAEANVDAKVKAPQYTGEPSVAADGTLELSAIPAAYAEKSDAEFTFVIKEGAQYATIIDGTTLKPTRENWVEGAKVVIEIRQGDYVGEATIAIVAVDALKYGYLTIEAADGNGGFKGVVDGETIIQNNPVVNKEFLIGTVVTLTAIPAADSEFRYWARVDASGTTVYSSDAELVLAVPYGITLKPVFKKVDSADYIVTFQGYQNAIFETYALSTVEGDVIIAPEAPEVFGYEFSHYAVAGWINTYAEGDEIPTSSIDADTVFVAKYNKKAEMEYTVTVVNGTVNDAETATVPYNSRVVVKANAAEEGMKFSHWAELGAEETAISYDEAFAFYMAAADRTVVAVFVEADAEVEVEPVVTMTVATIDGVSAEPIFGLYAERRVPEGYTVVENGIVYGYAGNKYGLTEESESVTLENYIGKSTSKYQNNNGQYTVRVQMTEARQARGDKWYASTYLIYRDANGVLFTVYSPKKLFWEKAE